LNLPDVVKVQSRTFYILPQPNQQTCRMPPKTKSHNATHYSPPTHQKNREQPALTST